MQSRLKMWHRLGILACIVELHALVILPVGWHPGSEQNQERNRQKQGGHANQAAGTDGKIDFEIFVMAPIVNRISQAHKTSESQKDHHRPDYVQLQIAYRDPYRGGTGTKIEGVEELLAPGISALRPGRSRCAPIRRRI